MSIRAFACVIVALAAFSAPPSFAGHSASETVETLHQSLLDVMKNAKTLGINGRYDKLSATLPKIYDFPRMIRIIVGSKWKTSNEEDRESLSNAFQRLSVTTYASQFSGYSGEIFEILPEMQGPRDAQIVETNIIVKGRKAVPISYVLYDAGEGWKIVDVLLSKSISELAIRRSEYRAILKSGGVKRLIAVLNDKADDLLAAP